MGQVLFRKQQSNIGQNKLTSPNSIKPVDNQVSLQRSITHVAVVCGREPVVLLVAGVLFALRLPIAVAAAGVRKTAGTASSDLISRNRLCADVGSLLWLAGRRTMCGLFPASTVVVSDCWSTSSPVRCGRGCSFSSPEPSL